MVKIETDILWIQIFVSALVISVPCIGLVSNAYSKNRFEGILYIYELHCFMYVINAFYFHSIIAISNGRSAPLTLHNIAH